MASNTQYFKRSGNSCSWTPFLSCFHGCDTVSAFRGKGKKSDWQTWEVFQDASDVFTPLSKRPHSLLQTVMEIIEVFVCIMFYLGTDTFAVNKARLELKATVVRCNSSFLRLFNGAYKRSSISGWTCMGSNSWMLPVYTKSWKLGLAKRKRKQQLETQMDHFNSCRSLLSRTIEMRM